jgi:acyl-CoA reductase-like NAD-dependent aldehyde dehydrogenase
VARQVESEANVTRVQLCIGDAWREGRGAEPIVVTSPATGEPIATVEQGSREDVAQAVDAAASALEPLFRMTAFERAALGHRVADLLLERKEEIAHDITLEQGKPYTLEALPEVDVAAGMFRDAAEAAKRLETAIHPSYDPAKRILTIRQPRGVYGIITPWNFPLAIPSEYLSAGLATGNAMVWKPSEWVPLSAMHLMRCFLDAGVPTGTLNLVPEAAAQASWWPSKPLASRYCSNSAAMARPSSSMMQIWRKPSGARRVAVSRMPARSVTLPSESSFINTSTMTLSRA